MTETVDLVIAGDGSAARQAAVDALRRGERVLVVLADRDADARRLRSCLCANAGTAAGRLRVLTNAEVVCADGVGEVEAVVVRHARTGRLVAVNAAAFLSFQAPPCRCRNPGGCR